MPRLLVVALVLLTSTACMGHQDTRPGMVVGSLPLCYGPSRPGEDLNLRPVSVVEVVQGKRVITSKSFTSTKDKLPVAPTVMEDMG